MTSWLITNKYYVSESFLSIKKHLVLAANNKGIDIKEYNNVDLIKMLNSCNLNKPDFVLFWDKDIKLASFLESEGIKVFNSSESIRVCDDKAITYLKLRNKGIKLPKTFFSPTLYYHNILEDSDIVDYISKELSFPFVLKECFGSFGKQVYLINSKEEFIERVRLSNNSPFIMQEFIKSSFGKDLRIYVVGKKCVAAMKRENTIGDFRANIEIGSSGFKYDLNEKQEEMALKVVSELGLSFGGIDLLFDENEEPIFCEANSNAYFNEINKILGVKVEDYIFDYIISCIG